MLNLTTLTWTSNKHVGEAPVTSEGSSEDLQTAFIGLKHPEKMEVDGYTPHPSLFLVPPESVKSLKPSAHRSSYRDIDELSEYRVKEVGVRGLKTLWLSRHLPSGLRACILAKNPDVISRKFSGKYAYDTEGERTEL
ncbi:hypothetical protein TWF679_002296 [Orbilia oligospora]|nr:hypothetical protein TWF679_002296 [Orbilia oligospora]